MAMSRSMLESLLARVRQRAVEPRQQVPPMPVSRVPQIDEEPESSAPVLRAVAVAEAAPVLEEEFIEEYDEELIEIIDDGDVASESAPESEPESAPLELRASAPSVEMRRHAIPMSAPPAVVPAPRVVPAPVAPALHAEVVARRPIPATPVVQSQGARRDARSSSFIELLDASLKLGS
jgi:hypothetical protein